MTSDEYRRNARECQRMADNARNPTDKASWLRLAASWLGMIKNAPAQPSDNDAQRPAAREAGLAASDRPEQVSWPNPSDEDSQASH
jgi:hypothetical protein